MDGQGIQFILFWMMCLKNEVTKFFKIKPSLNQFFGFFKEAYDPEEYLSIDVMISFFKSREKVPNILGVTYIFGVQRLGHLLDFHDISLKILKGRIN